LFACLVVAPHQGYDEPGLLSHAITSFYPTSVDGLQSSSSTLNSMGRAANRVAASIRINQRSCWYI
jgi:hypothetical protein